MHKHFASGITCVNSEHKLAYIIELPGTDVFGY